MRLACAVLVLAVVATTTGGAGHAVPLESLLLRLLDEPQLPPQRMEAVSRPGRFDAQGAPAVEVVSAPSKVTLRIHGLAADGIATLRAATDAYFNQRAQHSSVKKKYGQDVGGVDWETYRRDALNDLQGFGPTHVLEEAVDLQIASLKRFEKLPTKE